jgi:hypothetical protein
MSVHAPIQDTCARCHRQLGTSAGVVPHYVTDDAGDGKGKREGFCPRCFVFHIAPRHAHEDGRARFAPHWHPRQLVQGTLRPVLCKSAACVAVAGPGGMESLAHGHTGCSQCGNKRAVTLGEGPAESARAQEPNL